MNEKQLNILISDLRRDNSFCHRIIDNLKKELIVLRKDNKLYKQIIQAKVKVVFDRYDPKKFEKINKIIDGEALKLCGETGSWFHWKDLYERLVKTYKSMNWNPSTVDRRLQYACTEGLLTRVKPGTYIFNIHKEE